MLLAFAAAAVLVWGVWPRAEATPSRVAQLHTICTSPGGDCRKLLAIEELRTIGNTTARDAVRGLANSPDDRVAAMGISAIGRHEGENALSPIAGIYEDSARSDTARISALAAYCRIEAANGKKWSDVRKWVKEKAGQNENLRSAYAALKAKYWPTEANDE